MIQKLLTDEQVESFHENGYLVIPPEPCSLAIIRNLADKIWDYFPTWENGFNIKEHQLNRRELDFKVGPLSYYGCALSERAFTPALWHSESSAPRNWLYGKRVGLGAPSWDKTLVELIENQMICDYAKQTLKASNLSFHEGALVNVYPGCTGEEMKFHADTSGFTRNALEAVKKNHFVLNMMFYLCNVDSDLAPLRVFPKSHHHYLKLNDHLAGIFQKNREENCVLQGGYMFEELLPDFIEKPVSLSGPKGTMILMHSSLLHSATENKTTIGVRSTLNLNYSNQENPEFFKNFCTERKACKMFVRQFRNPSLVQHTFIDISLDPLKLLKKRAGLIRNKLIKYKKTVKLLASPKITFQNLKKMVVDLVFKTIRPCFNSLHIGKAPSWRHSHFISPNGTLLDKITLGKPLPFESNHFKRIYSSHYLQQLPENYGILLLQEGWRCLKKGSILRISCPDINLFFDSYEKRDILWFDWVRLRGAFIFDSWLRLIVRHFADPVVDKYSDEELYRLYREKSRIEFIEHFNREIKLLNPENLAKYPEGYKSWWTKNKLINILKEIGFSKVEESFPHKSRDPIFNNPFYFDKENPNISLYIEAFK